MGTFTQKTNYLKETKSMFKDRLNSLGAEITSSTTFRNYLVWLNNLYNKLQTMTVSGLGCLKGQTTQSGTPTPSSPVPINTTTGRQEIVVSDGTNSNTYEINLGKNLFNAHSGTTITSVNVQFTRNDDGTITLNGTSNNIGYVEILYAFQNGTTQQSNVSLPLNNTNSYSISLNQLSGTTTTSDVRLTVQYNSSGSQQNILMGTPQTISNSIGIYRAYIRIPSGAVFEDLTLGIQIEAGSVKTNYVEYKTPIELCKIGNYQDKIYKQNGNWYIYKTIGKYVYNNDLSNNSITANKVEMLTPVLDIVANKRPLTDIAICNMMGSVLTNYTGLDGTTSAKRIRVNMSTSYVSSYNEFKTLASNNNLTIYYVLTTPTTTLIEDEELINQLNEIEIFEYLKGGFGNEIN